MTAAVVIVTPVGQGRYTAAVGDRALVANSRTPFLSAARVLLDEGADPGAELAMRHCGSKTVRTTVGATAGMSVSDPDSGKSPPHLTPYWEGPAKRLAGAVQAARGGCWYPSSRQPRKAVHGSHA